MPPLCSSFCTGSATVVRASVGSVGAGYDSCAANTVESGNSVHLYACTCDAAAGRYYDAIASPNTCAPCAVSASAPMCGTATDAAG